MRNISPSPLSIKNHKVDTPFNGTSVIGAYKMEGAAVGSDSDPGLLATLLFPAFSLLVSCLSFFPFCPPGFLIQRPTTLVAFYF